jgi:hypothetical protein
MYHGGKNRHTHAQHTKPNNEKPTTTKAGLNHCQNHCQLRSPLGSLGTKRLAEATRRRRWRRPLSPGQSGNRAGSDVRTDLQPGHPKSADYWRPSSRRWRPRRQRRGEGAAGGGGDGGAGDGQVLVQALAPAPGSGLGRVFGLLAFAGPAPQTSGSGPKLEARRSGGTLGGGGGSGGCGSGRAQRACRVGSARRLSGKLGRSGGGVRARAGLSGEPGGGAKEAGYRDASASGLLGREIPRQRGAGALKSLSRGWATGGRMEVLGDVVRRVSRLCPSAATALMVMGKLKRNRTSKGVCGTPSFLWGTPGPRTASAPSG